MSKNQILDCCFLVCENSLKNYHTYKPFLKLIENKFGKIAADNILQITKIKLKRKIKD